MAGDTSSFERIPRVDRVRSVMKALADHIDRAGMKPGDKLPTERELSLALGVGRSTVREVIRQLQALGVAEPRVGSGTFLIRTISPGTIHMPLSLDMSHLRDALLQTLEVRRGIEVEASAVAAVFQIRIGSSFMRPRIAAVAVTLEAPTDIGNRP